MVFVNLKIVAVSDEDIRMFLQLCGVIQHLGMIGSCRKIPVVVDGDGSGKFSFYIDDKKIVPPSSIDIENIPDIWLGE